MGFIMVQCAFCLDDKERLEISHIIPKFFYRWMKSTATTGRMRDGRNMKVPAQDGLKKELLCNICEGSFSLHERYFATDIFSQMTSKDGDIDFESIEWSSFNKFILSLVWRTLYFSANESIINQDYFQSEIEYFNQVADNIKDYFTSSNELPLNIYWIPLTKSSVEKGIVEIEDYVYFERSIGLNLIVDDHDNQATTLYIKIPYAMIVCEINNCEHHKWDGLKLNDKEKYSCLAQKTPKHINDYIKWDCERCYSLAKEIPPHQVEKLKEIMTIKGSPEQGTIKSIIKNNLRKN